MQNSKIISKLNPDISMTDHVAIAWGLFQTSMIAPSSIPIHSIHYNHITRQTCTTISIEAGKSSVTTQPKLALLASHWAASWRCTSGGPGRSSHRTAFLPTERGRSPVSSRWSCPCHKLGFPLSSPSCFPSAPPGLPYAQTYS